MDLRLYLDQELAAGRRLIQVPPGVHTLATYKLPSGVTLQGPGIDRCLIRRDPRGTRILFDCRGQEEIAFRDLQLDIASDQNFSSHIHADAIRGLDVRRCRFIDTTTSVNEGWTTHAVLTRRGAGVRIVDNSTDNCQFKAGGADTIIDSNRCRTSRNLAISWVVDNGETAGWGRVTNNLCQGFWAGGIYIGADGDDDVGSIFDSCFVADNTILVEPEPGTDYHHPIGPYGILVRIGEAAQSVTLARNTISGGPVNSARPIIYIKRTLTSTDANIIHEVQVLDNYVAPETAEPYLRRGTLPFQMIAEPDVFIERGNSWQPPSAAGGGMLTTVIGGLLGFGASWLAGGGA